jgi:PAS domain S-box-containing protein
MGLVISSTYSKLVNFSAESLSEDINNEIKDLKSRKILSKLLLISSLFIAIISWQLFIKSQRNSLDSVLKMYLELIHYRLDSFIENRLNRIELFVSKNNDSNKINFSELNNLGFDLIALIDNELKIKEVNINSVNELVGTELGLEEKDHALLVDVFENNKKIITTNLHLYKPGKEINFFIPIKNTKEILVASIKIKHLMNYLFNDFSNALDINVFTKEKLLYKNSKRKIKLDNQKNFYWGLEFAPVYQNNNLAISNTETLNLIISPSDQLIRSLKLFSDKYYLAISMLLAFLSYFGIYYLLISKTYSTIIHKLIDKLHKQINKNFLLKNSLIQISRSAEKSIKSKEEQFKFHKSSAYKIMCEAIKSKKEQEDQSKTIKKSSHRLLLALESAGIGTWSWDLENNKIVWDSFIHKIFGIAPNKSIADYENFLDRVVIEDRERVDNEIKKAIEKNNKLESNFCIQCPDGIRKHVSLKARIFAGVDKTPIHITGTLQDLSYDINNSLLLNKFFALPIVMFCIADLRGNFKILNNAWTDTLGYSIQELKKYPFMFFVHDEDKEKTQMEYQLLMGENNYQCINFRNRYRTKNGSYKELIWNAIKAKGDNLIYAIVWEASQEISKRKNSIFQSTNTDSYS